MADYRDAKVHQYWLDEEFSNYYTILETSNGELRLIITSRSKDDKSKGDK
jgi:hypothetical protein